MKLPFIFIFDLDVILGNTNFILKEYELLNIIHKKCKIDNIFNKCIDKYDLTDELEEGLLRPNFTNFIQFITNKFNNVEFYIYSSNYSNKWINSGIITNIEKISNIKINKPYLIQLLSFDVIISSIISSIISKYPSLKSNKNIETVINNQLLFFNSTQNNNYSKLQIIPKIYNYNTYYNFHEKFINKYNINIDSFDNDEVLRFYDDNFLPIYNNNGTIFQKDIQLNLIIDLWWRRTTELNNDFKLDTFFKDLIILFKKKVNLKFDTKTIIKLNNNQL